MTNGETGEVTGEDLYFVVLFADFHFHIVAGLFGFGQLFVKFFDHGDEVSFVQRIQISGHRRQTLFDVILTGSEPLFGGVL